MSYQKQNFANGEVLTAPQLNHIEQGIVDVESAANATKAVVDNIIDPTLSLSGKAADAKAAGDAIRGVMDDLATETTRAKAAEQENAAAITAEAARAKSAEQANAEGIATETTRAQAAEKKNADAINAEVARAVEAEKGIAGDVATEFTRAKGEEQRLNTAITAETTRAEQAEQALDTRTAALESCGFVVVDGKICVRYLKR